MGLKNIIKNARIKKSLTELEVANSLNITLSIYQKYESGELIPKIEETINICELLEIDTTKIYLTDLFLST